MMKKLTLSLADEAIERILELSADSQITRRATAKDSPAFHNLTGAITAYGKTLAFLTALQRRGAFYAIIGQCEFSEGIAAVSDSERRIMSYRSAEIKACTNRGHPTANG
jgi:hypothetical protein